MRKRVGLVILAAACGSPAPAVVQLPQAASASAAPVSPKMPAAGCALQWNACRRVGEPVRVSGTSIGQSPEVAWDGHEALVTFDAPREGVHLAAIDERGRVLWIEALPGTNAQIAWNPRARTGLVVTSETIAWLGHDGKPLHRTNAPHVTNVTFHGATFATKDGFVVATGVASHASSATPVPFSVAITSAPEDAIDWKPAAGDGLRHVPLGGPGGEVAWMVSQPVRGDAQLFAVTPAGELRPPLTLPNVPTTRASAVSDDHGSAIVVFVDDVTHELSSVVVRGGAGASPEKLGVRSTRSGSAVFLRLGSRLFLGADKIGDSPGVALAPFDPSASPHVGAPLAIGPEKSQHLRVTPTDRGFVAVWNIADEGSPEVKLANNQTMHGLSTVLAIYACCPAAPE